MKLAFTATDQFSDMQKIIISLDVGSSSIRCTPFVLQTKQDGNDNETSSPVTAIPECASTYKGSSVKPGTGYIKIDIEGKTIVEIISSSIDQTLSLLRARKQEFEVVAVGITTFVMNLLGVSSDGTVSDSSHTCSYACNLETVEKQCVSLKHSLGVEKENELYQRTGAPIHPAYALPQLKSMYEKKDLDVKIWTTIASLCISEWTGQDIFSMPISFSEASWTGMMNFRSGEWEKDVIELLPKCCNDALPSISEEIFDGICKVYKERWPEMAQSKFILGFGDGACANIGSKCTNEERIAVTIGTSAAARIVLPLKVNHDVNREGENGNIESSKRRKVEEREDGDTFTIPKGLFCYRIDSDHILLGGALTDGGSVIEWIRTFLNLKDDDEYKKLESEAYTSYLKQSESSRSDNSLVFIPFLSGERSVGYRGSATGCITGLTRTTTPSDFLQEALQGVVMRLNAVLSLLKNANGDLEDTDPLIVASGNALDKNNVWREMIADCSNMDVILDEETKEATSRGVAILVAKQIQDYTSLPVENLVISRYSKPNPSRTKFWKGRQNLQERNIICMDQIWK